MEIVPEPYYGRGLRQPGRRRWWAVEWDMPAAETPEFDADPFGDPATLAERPAVAAKQGPDLRALEQAANRLRAAYRRLNPALKDPERLTLRYWRTQQRARWILSNYGRLLPEEVVARVGGRTGRAYLATPFDETVPSRRAVVNLRAITRELLAAVEVALAELSRGHQEW